MIRNRHVLVRREEVTQEQRHSTDCICIEGDSGRLDQRHANGRVVPLKLRTLEGEKIFILQLDLLYCTNDTNRDWRFEVRGLWDGGGTVQILVPPANQTRGPVPEKDQCIYKNPIASKWKKFMPWIGQEHALLNVHSTYTGPVAVEDRRPIDGQLFEESDPFLQFTREHWTAFKDLSQYDVTLVSEPKDVRAVYRISQHAIDRVTHALRTLFAEVHYKTRDPWLELRVDPVSVIGNTTNEEAGISTKGMGFHGIVIMLQAKYLVVSPAVPQCRVVEQALIL